MACTYTLNLLCRFSPPEDFAPFVLANGLFYNNALENAASAMEIAAIAGKNCAILSMQYLSQGLKHLQGSTERRAEL